MTADPDHKNRRPTELYTGAAQRSYVPVDRR
jgi:hypothetical protein